MSQVNNCSPTASVQRPAYSTIDQAHQHGAGSVRTPSRTDTHGKLLFADDNTLWIGSQTCSSGECANQASSVRHRQCRLNYNCLTSFNDLRRRHGDQVVPAQVATNSNGHAERAVPQRRR